MNTSLLAVQGVITEITPMRSQLCNCVLTLDTGNGIVNVIVSPSTCIVGDVPLNTGMAIAAFYDANAPMLLIYPPQYNALIIEKIKL